MFDMSLNVGKQSDMTHQVSKPVTRVVMNDKGDVVEVSSRMPVGKEIAVIDALNFVVHPDTFDTKLHETMCDSTVSDEVKRKLAYDTASHIACLLKYIMGEDFSHVYDTGVSRNRYRYTFRIGEYDMPLGLIGIDNFNTKNPSILVMIYGEGTHIADEWWEFGLFNWLSSDAIQPRITRCDLAHDDLTGAYSSAELADTADSNGGFALTNKLPKVQHLGDWKRHEGRGRTLQVGSRENGKLYRGYEKGKQLGDKTSLWFRHEVELGNKSRIIPLDILLNPSDYFAGSYPYMAEISQYAVKENNVFPTRIKTIKKSNSISFQRAIDVVKHQFGRYLKVFRDFADCDTDILDILVTEKKDYYPKRLRLLEKVTFRHSKEIVWDDILWSSMSLQDKVRRDLYAF